MLNAVAFSPLVSRLRLSEERKAPPEAVSTAPPVADELSQPRPRPLGGFPHGQAATSLVPGSQRLEKSVPPSRSRTNVSRFRFWSVSLATRFVASLVNDTTFPSSDTQASASKPAAFASAPPVETLILSVVARRRSRRKTSRTPFASPGTRFVASLRKDTKRPSAEI